VLLQYSVVRYGRRCSIKGFPDLLQISQKMKLRILLDFRKARGRALSLGGPGILTLTANPPELCARVAASHRHDRVTVIPAS
jgi:hypothetical protein